MSENQSCERSNFSKGDFVTINGQVGIVAMVGAELPADMDDHCAVFFGPERVPRGGSSEQLVVAPHACAYPDHANSC